MNEGDCQEASEEHNIAANSSVFEPPSNTPDGSIFRGSGGAESLLNEEVFISQLHRRAALLNGDNSCAHKTA